MFKLSWLLFLWKFDEKLEDQPLADEFIVALEVIEVIESALSFDIWDGAWSRSITSDDFW